MEDHSAEEAPQARAWLRFRVAYLLIAASAVLFGVKFLEQAWHDREESRQLTSALAQYNAEQRQIRHLTHEIARDKTLAFVRHQARAWGYVARGQQLVMISFKQSHHHHHPFPAHVHRSTPRHATPVWQQWWHAFFGG